MPANESTPASTKRKSIALPEELWDAIATYRHGKRLKSETLAIQCLLKQALHSPKGEAHRPVAQA